MTSDTIREALELLPSAHALPALAALDRLEVYERAWERVRRMADEEYDDGRIRSTSHYALRQGMDAILQEEMNEANDSGQ